MVAQVRGNLYGYSCLSCSLAILTSLIFIVGHLFHRTSKLTIRLGLMPDSIDMMGNKPHFFSGPVSSLPIPAALIFIRIYAHMFLAAPSSCLRRLTSHEQSKVMTIGLQSWLTSRLLHTHAFVAHIESQSCLRLSQPSLLFTYRLRAFFTSRPTAVAAAAGGFFARDSGRIQMSNLPRVFSCDDGTCI